MAEFKASKEAIRILQEVNQELVGLGKPTNYEEFERGVQLANKYFDASLVLKKSRQIVIPIMERCLGRVSFTPPNDIIDAAIFISADDWIVYDCLLHLASNSLRDNTPLSDNLREWLADVVSDMVSKKKKRPRPIQPRGPNKQRYIPRDLAIKSTIYQLVQCGWTEVGSEASIKTDKKTDKEWANSAVFAVTKVTGLKFDAVKSARVRPIGEKSI